MDNYTKKLVHNLSLTDDQRVSIDWLEATIIEDDARNYFFVTEKSSIRVFTHKQQREIDECKKSIERHESINANSIANGIRKFISEKYSINI